VDDFGKLLRRRMIPKGMRGKKNRNDGCGVEEQWSGFMWRLDGEDVCVGRNLCKVKWKGRD